METPEKAVFTSGAMRAGVNISERFRKTSDSPVPNALILAEIISAETHDAELLAALQTIVHTVSLSESDGSIESLIASAAAAEQIALAAIRKAST